MTSRVTAALAAAVVAASVIEAATACHSGGTNASGSATSMSPSASPTGGQSAGTAAGSASPTPVGPSKASLTTCQTAELALAVDGSQADAAAGSTYYPVNFTNTSATACAMAGFPGVSFVTDADQTGRQIGAAAQRNPQYGSTPVTLEPHAHAHAWLQVADAGNYPAASCHPVTAHALRIYPPDETAAGYVTQDFPACAVDSAQLLTILPVRPGKGAMGSTP